MHVCAQIKFSCPNSKLKILGMLLKVVYHVEDDKFYHKLMPDQVGPCIKTTCSYH